MCILTLEILSTSCYSAILRYSFQKVISSRQFPPQELGGHSRRTKKVFLQLSELTTNADALQQYNNIERKAQISSEVFHRKVGYILIVAKAY